VTARPGRPASGADGPTQRRRSSRVKRIPRSLAGRSAKRDRNASRSRPQLARDVKGGPHHLRGVHDTGLTPRIQSSCSAVTQVLTRTLTVVDRNHGNSVHRSPVARRRHTRGYALLVKAHSSWSG
jgi:hypothetical protein